MRSILARDPLMRRVRVVTFLLLGLWVAIATSLPVAAADVPEFARSATLERIKRTGTITFAYREGAPPFSFKSREGRVHGYSVELCDRISIAVQRELGLKTLKVDWVPVTADTRLS